MDLADLQNKIKRDKESYRDEFFQQLNHYGNLLEIFKMNPSSSQLHLTELITFLAHVCYMILFL